MIQNNIKIIELFSGIGAIRKAFINQKIKHKVLFFSEIDSKAIQSYRKIFKDNITPNLGNISKIKKQQLKNYQNKCDLLVFGSPCQDFSHGGNNKGGQKGTNTRSSLLWEAVRIIEFIKPKTIIFENVKNLIYKHKPVLNEYQDYLAKLGYTNFKPLLLNALNFGIPQNRERIFTIASFSKSFQNSFLESLKKYQTPRLSLENFLNIKNFEERNHCPEKIEYKNWTNFATWTSKNGKNINGSYNRAWYINKYCGTLNVCNIIKITDGYNVSKLTAEEAFLLMGFDNKDFQRISDLKLSENQLHALAGNSIVVNILEKIISIIYKNDRLYNSSSHLKNNSKKPLRPIQQTIFKRV